VEYKTGQLLKFKKNIDVNVWVDCVLPAGQMGLLETHARIRMDEIAIDIPFKLIKNLFVDGLDDEIPAVPRKRKKKDA
tara:strand:- start:2863 stop:3096 length:234 start_codon:yes stop_codon:yes gene_type:complete